METVVRDFTHALRSLTRRKSFSAIVLATFALGIGATTAIFTVLNSVLLRPLPYPAADELVQLWETRGEQLDRPFSIPNLESLREGTQSFAAIGAWMSGDFPSVTLTGGDQPERIPGAMITPEILTVLGVAPALGRNFLPGEIEPGSHLSVILSHELWQSRFGADPEILGRVLPLNGEGHTVVGVMPPGFEFPATSNARVWRPLPYFATWRQNRGNHLLEVTARLNPGVTLDVAGAEVAALAQRLAAEFPETNTGESMRLLPLHQHVVGNVRPALFALMSAVVLLWLIASVNVANLFIARVVDREREIAVRVALGASRGRIGRLVVTESAVMALLGGAIGLGVATAGVQLLVAAGPESVPRLDDARLDAVAVLFALGMTVLTALASALFPALRLTRGDLPDLGHGSRRATMGRGGRRTRDALVSVEVALALVLMIGAGLLLQTFLRLTNVDPGFATENALTAEINLPSARYPGGAQRRQFYTRLMPALEALPGVISAGAISVFPLSGNPGGGTPLHRPDATTMDEGFLNRANLRVVWPTYFETVGMALLSGRQFTDRDGVESRNGVIVNETLAARLWPGEDPVGRRMFGGQPGDSRREYEVVGLVADVKETSLGEAVLPVIFLPYPRFAMQEMVVILRTAADPDAMASSLREAVLAIDPDQPVEAVQSVDAIVARSVAQPKFNMLLLVLFAAVAVLLSAVGIYGVTANAVSVRTREIGIRVALGANDASILGLIVRQGLLPAGVGVMAGLAAAIVSTKLLANLVFGIGTTHLATYAVCSLGLLLVATVGSLTPAWRATRVDPTRALASE